MNTLVIDKENALASMQKIIKLVSAGKRLEIKEIEIKKDSIRKKMEKSLDNAVKEYKNGEYTTLLTIN